jgi:hypothetical protein
MKSENLQQVMELTRRIDEINFMEKEFETFRSNRFRGAMPNQLARYMNANPERALRYAQLIMEESMQEREKLQLQLNAI